MYLVDHVLILLLFVVQPVWGAIEARRIEARCRAGQRLDRIRFYSQTVLLECTFLAVLFTAWFALDRTVADLGVVAPGGAGFWTGTVLLVAFTGLLAYQWRSATKASDEEKAQLAESFGKLEQYMPHNTRELNGFYGVSIVAGIVEEIVYRGFVLWYLAQFMPLWVAVAVSSVAFGLGHSYQGPSGALRTGLVGLAFGIFYVTTGSIWLPIIAHILLDALQGGTVHEILRKDDDSLDPKLSPE
jgi:membrane protease YdiL (CAAX protease family)